MVRTPVLTVFLAVPASLSAADPEATVRDDHAALEAGDVAAARIPYDSGAKGDRLMDVRTPTRLVCLAVVLLVGPFLAVAGAQPPGPVVPGTFLGSTGAIGLSMIDIDPATGGGTFRAGLGTFGPVTALEFRADGVLFGTTGGGGSSLITVDPTTGAESLVGMHPFGAVTGLQFIGSTLYGAYVAAPQGFPVPPYVLVTIDQTDATLTTIGPLDGYFPMRGLAYDDATGTLYGIGVPSIQPPPLEGVGDSLLIIDPTDATVTAVGPTGVFLGALELGADGQLYAAAEGGGGNVEGSADLFTIDVGTGIATPVGPTGFPAISALALVPGVDPIIEIPTLDPGGLLALALLVAFLAIVGLRRGRRAVAESSSL